MKPRVQRLLSWLAPLWAALFAAVSGALVLRRALAPGRVLASPDSQPLYSAFAKEFLPINILGERCEIPSFDTLLALLLPTATYSDLSYIAATAVIAFAVALYLRRWRCPPSAAVFGGLALAFSGYHFTLFNAGHRGYFLMTAHALLLLVAVDGMVDSGRWPWFVIGAVCAVCALRPQPDVFVLWCGVLAVYAVLRAVRRLRTCPREMRPRLLARWVSGAVAFAAVAILFGSPSIRYIATSLMAGRESQIEQAGGSGEEENPEEAAAARWDFATSWSLPPAELPELACPNLRGYDTGNPDGPYWGSLGRNVHYGENGGQGFFNFRQHTLYLGALTLLFALFAILAKSGSPESRVRSPKSEVQSPKSEVRSPESEDESLTCDAGLVNSDQRTVIFFWLVVAVVSLVLAMGRYTPVYRLFYALPKMSSIRGPVKFLHFAEVAFSLLAGFGMARFQESLATAEPRRRALAACAGVAGLAALALLSATLVAPSGLAEALPALGIPADAAANSAFRRFATILTGLRLKTLLTTAAIFGLGGAAFLFAGFAGAGARRRATVALPAALCAALLLDMGRAATPYVNDIDPATFGTSNALVESLRATGQLDGSRWGGNIPGLTDKTPFLHVFWRYGFYCSDPLPSDDPQSEPIQAALHFREAMDPFRRWQFMGTRLVFTTPEHFSELPASAPQFAKLGLYAYRAGAIVKATPESAHFGVIALRNWLPSAAVYPVWEFAPDATAAWARIVDPELDLSRAAVLEGAPACTAKPEDSASVPAKETTTQQDGRQRRMVFETAADSPAGMLVVRMPFMSYTDVCARVDGNPAPTYVANRFSRAVPVPAGRHEVELYLPLSTARAAAYAATLLLVLAALWTLLRPRK